MKKIVSVLAAVWFFCACSAAAGAEKSEKLKVITTIFPVYDFARAVAGDRAEISMLVRPGAEIHTFDPSPKDIIEIQNADVFICVGGESEAWVDTLLKPMPGKTVLRLIEHVKAVKEELVEGMQPEEEEEEEEAYDEHIWTSPRNAALLVRAAAETLSGADPANALFYRESAESYVEKIKALSEKFQALVASAKRKTILFGDRYPFRYFSDEFGLEYRAAFPGCAVEGDASAATVAYLVRFAEREKIPVIYTLEFSSGNIARTIAGETGAEVLILHSCHNVTREEFQTGVTWLDLMKKNLENLRKGLY
ncbi:MAG: metal ABC transporter substrate-binding protein [Synergistaceae bacterium]|jgi:zinc transport system substrate-binding protein|nr:metal ABC transporter substrate-binding protein [Synergistaceae bacterium]